VGDEREEKVFYYEQTQKPRLSDPRTIFCFILAFYFYYIIIIIRLLLLPVRVSRCINCSGSFLCVYYTVEEGVVGEEEEKGKNPFDGMV
jgi:hypothetical protein